MSKRKNKPLGKAFHGYLAQCERFEHFLIDGPTQKLEIEATPEMLGNFMHFVVQQVHRYTGKTELALEGLMDQQIVRWAADAQLCREVFKFQGDWNDIAKLHLSEACETGHPEKPVIVRPPFDSCMLMINGIPAEYTADVLESIGIEELRDVMPDLHWRHAALLIEERTFWPNGQPGMPDGIFENACVGDWYSDRMKEGDKFFSCSMYLCTGYDRKFDGILPFETHHMYDDPGEFAPAIARLPGVPEAVQESMQDDWLKFMRMQLILLFGFLGALSARDLQQATVPGRKPGLKIPPPKKRKPYDRIFYEHITVTIDPMRKIQFKEDGGPPRAGVRQHPVRGFRRYFKKPLRSGPHKGQMWTWVYPHHRGDKELGVISHDYDLAHDHGQGREGAEE